MREKGKVLLFALSLITVCFADNPVIQTCYTADPAPMVYNGRVYLYVGHDSSAAPANSYLMRYWKCYSSTDMVNWTDHGAVLYAKPTFSWCGGDANAAQVIHREGKFYYYISTGGPGGIAIGVGIADSPTGPFKDAIGKPLIINSQTTYASHSWDDLDPTVFIDDNEQAYLYWGNNACYWVKLNKDMITTNGSINAIPLNSTAFGPDFEEAPWVYKRKSLYYLIYASGFPECIRYSTSTSPSGPWTYKGQIQPTQPNGVSNTIHPGIIDFKENSYYFYHNASLPGGHSYKRSVCIEQFKYNTDGTIPAIPATTGGVVKGVDNLNPYDTTQAETICWASGVRTEVCSEGGIDVDSIHNGDYIKVKGVDFGTGASSFMARVASAAAGGKIELRLDSQTGTLIGTCNVSTTGGWQKWATETCTISGATGIHDLFLKFTGGSGLLFNFNWWKFDRQNVGVEMKQMISNSSKFKLKVKKSSGKAILALTIPSFKLNEGDIKISLFDVSGRYVCTAVIKRSQNDNQQVDIHFPVIKSGTYLVKLFLSNELISSDHFTIK